MGLGFGLELGQVRPEDLAKARQMVPRALEQYVTQLAEKGPGSNAAMPRVTTPVKASNVVVVGESPNSSDVDIS